MKETVHSDYLKNVNTKICKKSSRDRDRTHDRAICHLIRPQKPFGRWFDPGSGSFFSNTGIHRLKVIWVRSFLHLQSKNIVKNGGRTKSSWEKLFLSVFFGVKNGSTEVKTAKILFAGGAGQGKHPFWSRISCWTRIRCQIWGIDWKMKSKNGIKVRRPFLGKTRLGIFRTNAWARWAEL